MISVLRRAPPSTSALSQALGLLLSLGLSTVTAPAHAQAPSNQALICVWDILGKSGDVYNLLQDQSLHMARLNMPFEMRAYTDERIAVEDYRSGQCAGLVVTGFRARGFNAFTGSIDSMGSALVLRNGQIDMKGSYEVVRRAIAALSSPLAAKLVREGPHEIGGLLPVGAAYPMLRDRSAVRLDQLAGKRIGVFDQDRPQALLIQQLGAQAVSVDIANVGSKFNNGLVDVIHLPAITYKPFELAKGMGTQGAVVRVPAMFPTVQLVFYADRVPKGFGEASRQFWLSQFDRQMQTIQRSEASIPPRVWLELSPEVLPTYVEALRQVRIAGAQQGLYSKRTLNTLKKVRCSVVPENAECATATEVD